MEECGHQARGYKDCKIGQLQVKRMICERTALVDTLDELVRDGAVCFLESVFRCVDDCLAGDGASAKAAGYEGSAEDATGDGAAHHVRGVDGLMLDETKTGAWVSRAVEELRFR